MKMVAYVIHLAVFFVYCMTMPCKWFTFMYTLARLSLHMVHEECMQFISNQS